MYNCSPRSTELEVSKGRPASRIFSARHGHGANLRLIKEIECYPLEVASVDQKWFCDAGPTRAGA